MSILPEDTVAGLAVGSTFATTVEPVTPESPSTAFIFALAEEVIRVGSSPCCCNDFA
jgi:hypothetical protein